MISSWEDDTIDLIYLAPPFNSKTHYNIVFGNQPNGVDFTAFNDIWHWDAGAVEKGKVTVSKNQNDRVALWSIEDLFRGIQPKIMTGLVQHRKTTPITQYDQYDQYDQYEHFPTRLTKPSKRTNRVGLHNSPKKHIFAVQRAHAVFI